ncbi:hypothetical protein LCGC14_0142260 [marine sediment metagenome]|uniref:Uncharacterized protein n=1 Tax=marine sediment metagenome TaxID=412755 RepID=A0A0F9XIF8_9ZZZZ
MKRVLAVLLMLVAMVLPMAGCSTTNGNNWQDNAQTLKSDIFVFSKLATRLVLSEANTPSEDVVVVEGYLIALKDLLAVPGTPNFAGARQLAKMQLPQKYQIYGLTIIDLLERYLVRANLSVTDDQELIIGLINAGIDGALDAVEEFRN